MQIAGFKGCSPIYWAQNRHKTALSQSVQLPNRTVSSVRKALDEIVMSVQLGKEKRNEPRVDISALLEGQNVDPYSGDFTDIGSRLASVNMGPIDLDKALALNRPIHITDSVIVSKEEQLEILRKEGLPKELDWFKVELDFSLPTDVLLTDSDCRPDQTIAYYASKYVALRAQITMDFTGNEQKAQLDRLDKILTDSTESYARNLAQALGGYYEESGMSGEKDTIYRSVRESIQEKISAYTLFAESNPNFVKIDHPEDQWLYRSNDYVASQLRAAAGQEDEGFLSETNLYTAHGLGSLFDFAMGGIHLMRSSLSGKNAGDTGVRAGVLLLEFQMLREHSAVSDEHKNALQTRLLSKISGETESDSTARVIVKRMNDVFQETKSLTDALDAGLQMGTDTSAATRSIILQSMRNMFNRIGLDANTLLQKTNHLGTEGGPPIDITI